MKKENKEIFVMITFLIIGMGIVFSLTYGADFTFEMEQSNNTKEKVVVNSTILNDVEKPYDEEEFKQFIKKINSEKNIEFDPGISELHKNEIYEIFFDLESQFYDDLTTIYFTDDVEGFWDSTCLGCAAAYSPSTNKITVLTGQRYIDIESTRDSICHELLHAVFVFRNNEKTEQHKYTHDEIYLLANKGVCYKE